MPHVRLYRDTLKMLVILALAGCSKPPSTKSALEGEAQQAVNRDLQAQGVYSLMESALPQQIACGHVSLSGSKSRELDFVYRKGRVILDDSPEFDSAARECDDAAREG